MKKALVYSHDTFGLGNIRRMLAICEHLLASISDLSILLVTGSPMVHSLRLPSRLDYIKLPCLTRTERESYAAKYLDIGIDDAMRLRSDLILHTVADFQPDLLLVDKKPYGINHELERTLRYLKRHHPATKQVLVLRDILDSPDVTRQVWQQQGYYAAIQALYDQVLVLGSPAIFNPVAEYAFPSAAAQKVRFTGYLRRAAGIQGRSAIRAHLQLADDQPLVLVTPGGGQDGYRLLDSYITGLDHLPAGSNLHSVIISGPELPEAQRRKLQWATAHRPQLSAIEFTNDLMSYIEASDVVVSMGGYNTVCEILSAGKRAVVVPRAKPVAEQWIRAERMAKLGLFTAIHPDALIAQHLIDAVLAELHSASGQHGVPPQLDLDGLPNIAQSISRLLADQRCSLSSLAAAVSFADASPSIMYALSA